MSFGNGLPQPQMRRLTEEVLGATRKLSREQMLDLADVLHDAIRERRGEERSWRPTGQAFGRRGR